MPALIPIAFVAVRYCSSSSALVFTPKKWRLLVGRRCRHPGTNLLQNFSTGLMKNCVSHSQVWFCALTIIATSAEISPTFCCGHRSMRCGGPYSLKPLRQRERASVGYAFSAFRSAKLRSRCGPPQHCLGALATKVGEISALALPEPKAVGSARRRPRRAKSPAAHIPRVGTWLDRSAGKVHPPLDGGQPGGPASRGLGRLQDPLGGKVCRLPARSIGRRS